MIISFHNILHHSIECAHRATHTYETKSIRKWNSNISWLMKIKLSWARTQCLRRDDSVFSNGTRIAIQMYDDPVKNIKKYFLHFSKWINLNYKLSPSLFLSCSECFRHTYKKSSPHTTTTGRVTEQKKKITIITPMPCLIGKQWFILRRPSLFTFHTCCVHTHPYEILCKCE